MLDARRGMRGTAMPGGKPSDGAQHRLTLSANLASHLEWISFLESRIKEFHRKRSRIPLRRYLPQNLRQRTHPIPGNLPRPAVQHLPRNLRYVLEVDMVQLPGVDQFQV